MLECVQSGFYRLRGPTLDDDFLRFKVVESDKGNRQISWSGVNFDVLID